MRNFYVLIGIVFFSLLEASGQNRAVSGSCIQGSVILVQGGDPSNMTYNNKPVYFNGALPVDFLANQTTASTYLYFALSSELGTPEDRWVIGYDGQPYYYFISNSEIAPLGDYLPFDSQASVSSCGGIVSVSIECISLITPVFSAVEPICLGQTLSPLPLNSLSDASTGAIIHGTWTPELNNAQTTTYTFTPNQGQCANANTLEIIVNPTSNYYIDSDSDGYGSGAATAACTAPTGYVTTNTDCNNSNAAVNPAATEICNSIDDDCDTQIDEGLTFTNYYLDADGDTYGTSAPANTTLLINQDFDSFSNALTSGWIQQNLSNPIGSTTYFQGDPGPFSSHSGATNSYLAANYNSGAGTAVISSWFISPEVNLVNGGQFSFWTRTTTPVMTTYPDRLQIVMSAAGTSTNAGSSATSVGDFTTLLLDVNPTYTTTGYPSSWTQYTVTVSGITAPTSGRFAFRYFVENGGINGANSDYIGIDDVSYTVPANVVSTCNGAPVGYVSSNTDCNESNSSVNPGATEICNSIDDDCDTQIDEGVQINYYADTDVDGYGAGTATLACTVPTGFVTTSTDCNNTNPAVNPAATEICNSIDDDCDTQIDEGVQINYYADTDGDGYGAGTATLACTAPTGFVTTSTDCNNTNPAVNPTATEICNSIDDDCDTQIDEGVLTTYYLDADVDSYGNAGSSVQACTLPVGYVTNSSDCNDTNIAINPTTVWYLNADGDGYYVWTSVSCTSPGANYNTTGGIAGDCNDANAAVNAGATETCNGIDDDCDGMIDENSSNTY